jgi:hypothetical protein
MKTKIAIAIAACSLFASAAQAANAPGIGQDGSFTWEQVRFYGPNGGTNWQYTGGQPTSIGSVPTDYCAGTDRCGEPMTFSTQYGGLLTVTASDDGNGRPANTSEGLPYQDLVSNYGGLGVVSRSSSGVVSGSDELNYGDTLTLSFAKAVKIVGFHFYDKNHGSSDLNPGSGDKFGLSIDGANRTGIALNQFPFWGQSSTMVGTQFTFSYWNEDYYLGAIKIAEVPIPAVPEPQTYALMLAGLGSIVVMARRRRAQQQA